MTEGILPQGEVRLVPSPDGFVAAFPSLCSYFPAVRAVNGFLPGSDHPSAEIPARAEEARACTYVLERQLVVWGTPAFKGTVKAHLIHAHHWAAWTLSHLTHS